MNRSAFSSLIIPVTLLILLGVIDVGRILAGESREESAEVEPIAVIATAGIDRLLEDIDYIFGSVGQQHVQNLVRGFLSNLNDLKGLDRSRPIGAFLFLRPLEQKEPQPVFFFPVSDVEELISSVRLGNALRLMKTDRDDRLTFITEDGEQPVRLTQGYAFLAPAGQSRWLDANLPNPTVLIGESLNHNDVVLTVRRQGLPEALLPLVAAGLREESAKSSQRKAGESQQEYQLRLAATDLLLDIADAFIKEVQTLNVGLRLSSEEKQARISAQLQLTPDESLANLLTSIKSQESRFAGQINAPAPFTFASTWSLTSGGQELLLQVLSLIRQKVHEEVGRGDATIRETADDVLGAIDASIRAGRFDSFGQILGGPPNAFTLLGAVAVAEPDVIARGLERFLPFANESPDVAELEMNVAQCGGTAIHRLQPRKLRRQDQVLYGGQASFYLASGEGALWFALGEEEALDLLMDSLNRASLDERHTPDESEPSPPLLSVTTHLTDWIGLAPATGDSKNARLARIARDAFSDAQRDRFHADVSAASDGLRVNVTFDEGYIRLLGLAVAAQAGR